MTKICIMMSSNSSPSSITDVFIVFRTYLILYLELSDWSNYSIHPCIALHCGKYFLKWHRPRLGKSTWLLISPSLPIPVSLTIHTSWTQNLFVTTFNLRGMGYGSWLLIYTSSTGTQSFICDNLWFEGRGYKSWLLTMVPPQNL